MAVLTPRMLEYPFTREKISSLKAGEIVRISGLVFTARDRLHKYLYEGGKSPVDLKDSAFYHCGPIVIRKNDSWVVQAAGPTTSSRQNAYMPRLLEQYRIRVIIGKGGMDENTRKACMKHGCVYLQAVGGAAALTAGYVREVRGVHFLKEFGSADALWELVLKDFEAVVAVDATGKSLFRRTERFSRQALEEILRR